MRVLDTIPLRHSVRKFLDKPIHVAKAAQLQYVIDGCNQAYGTHIQLITEDPQVFAKAKAFENAVNYIALVGSKKSKPKEALGYCGEMLVLKAQAIGLNTCWVAGTYRKRKVKASLAKGEKLYGVIAVGYGVDQGQPHKVRKAEKKMDAPEPQPQWFLDGVDAAMLAPTALHQQKFKFILCNNGTVKLKSGGFCKRLNAGILKYHFETGAGIDNFLWNE